MKTKWCQYCNKPAHKRKHRFCKSCKRVIQHCECGHYRALKRLERAFDILKGTVYESYAVEMAETFLKRLK